MREKIKQKCCPLYNIKSIGCSRCKGTMVCTELYEYKNKRNKKGALNR